MTEPLRAIAARFREERELERWSQYQLAEELGVTRAKLSNFELCQSPVSFAVGFEFCRRLDLSPRWLATGKEPKRPFPPLAELEVPLSELQRQMKHGVDFLSGYERFLRIPMERWTAANPPEKLVERSIGGGLEPLLRRWSSAEIIAQLSERIAALRAGDDKLRQAHADMADTLLNEISARLAVRRSKPRKSR